MALLIEETIDVAAHVSSGVVDAYLARSERVQTMALSELVADSVATDLSDLTAVVIGDIRTVEVVVDNHFDLERLAAAAWVLAGRGWDVMVLVPCNRIGDAHASLRAAPCLLQPWWFDEDGVWFGNPETP